MNPIIYFFNDINEIYNNISIYRGILIVKNNKEARYIIKLLKNHDYDPILIKNHNIDKNYRLFVITLNNINFLNYIDKNDYNFIAYNYYTIK